MVTSTESWLELGFTPTTVPVTPLVTPEFRFRLCSVGPEPDAPETPKLKLTIWPACTQAKVFWVVQVEDVLKPVKVVFALMVKLRGCPVERSVTTTWLLLAEVT